jgi:hypothetical protein
VVYLLVHIDLSPTSRAWQPATAPTGEFELAPPVPPLYVRLGINSQKIHRAFTLVSRTNAIILQ